MSGRLDSRTNNCEVKMPTIDCSACGRKISTQATRCPGCGHPHTPWPTGGPRGSLGEEKGCLDVLAEIVLWIIVVAVGLLILTIIGVTIVNIALEIRRG